MKLALLAVMLLLTVSVTNSAKPQPPKDKNEPDPVKLWPEDKALFIASDLIVKVRQGEAEVIRFLQSIPAESDEDRQSAPPKVMQFLGAIRSVEAVSVLCDRLLWEKRFREVVGHRHKYPASAALVQIGTPAVKGLLSKVSSVDVSKVYRSVVVGILVDVLGKDGVVKAIDDFKIDDKSGEADGRKRLDAIKQEFQVLYKIK